MSHRPFIEPIDVGSVETFAREAIAECERLISDCEAYLQHADIDSTKRVAVQQQIENARALAIHHNETIDALPNLVFGAVKVRADSNSFEAFRNGEPLPLADASYSIIDALRFDDSDDATDIELSLIEWDWVSLWAIEA